MDSFEVLVHCVNEFVGVVEAIAFVPPRTLVGLSFTFVMAR
jgi:hypothetical protein